MYDAVIAVVNAVRQLQRTGARRLRVANLSCDDLHAWSHGGTLYNYVNMASLSRFAVVVYFSVGRGLPFSTSMGERPLSPSKGRGGGLSPSKWERGSSPLPLVGGEGQFPPCAAGKGRKQLHRNIL